MDQRRTSSDHTIANLLGSWKEPELRWPWARLVLAIAGFIILLALLGRVDSNIEGAQAAGEDAVKQLQSLAVMSDADKERLGRENVTEAEAYQTLLFQFDAQAMQANGERELWIIGGLAAAVLVAGQASNEIYLWRHRQLAATTSLSDDRATWRRPKLVGRVTPGRSQRALRDRLSTTPRPLQDPKDRALARRSIQVYRNFEYCPHIGHDPRAESLVARLIATGVYVPPRLDPLGLAVLAGIVLFLCFAFLSPAYGVIAFVIGFGLVLAICIVWNLRVARLSWQAQIQFAEKSS